jgi:uncharacterized protein YfeS
MSKHYFDDPDEGPAPDTSHPRYVALAGDDEVYYDCCDDFSPFGNDDGADVLAMLEEWYQDGGKDAEIMDFVDQTLDDWDFGLPEGIVGADQATVDRWLDEEDMHANYLASTCRALLAAALGQLKISGKINPELHQQAQTAIDSMLSLNQRARAENPAWEHADAEVAYLNKMKAALAQL